MKLDEKINALFSELDEKSDYEFNELINVIERIKSLIIELGCDLFKFDKTYYDDFDKAMMMSGRMCYKQVKRKYDERKNDYLALCSSYMIFKKYKDSLN